MKLLFLSLSLMLSTVAFSKTLTVSCDSKTKKFDMVSQITEDAHKPQIITINDAKVQNIKDASKLPIFKDGEIFLSVQFGSKLFSSAELKVRNCDSEFLASGELELKEFSTKLQGSVRSKLFCSCSISE